MVAATYLLRDLWDVRLGAPVLLFEGLVSYKDRPTRSGHEAEVVRLKEAVRGRASTRGAFSRRNS